MAPTPVTIRTILQSFPLDSLRTVDNEDGSFTITYEDMRLAIENLLQDHSFAMDVTRAGDRFIITEMRD